MGLGSEQTDRGLASLVARLTDGFSKLVTQHLALARAEILEDARSMGMELALIAAFVPFIVVGYAFLCAALAAVLQIWLGWAGALALVGALNLVGGIVGVRQASTRLRAVHVMNDSKAELKHSVDALAHPPASAALPPEVSRGR